jgi:hypothetical protein
LVYNWKTAATQYAYGWLLIDILSTIPYEYISLGECSAQQTPLTSDSTLALQEKNTSALQLLRLLRIVKVVRVWRIFGGRRWVSGGGGWWWWAPSAVVDPDPYKY